MLTITKTVYHYPDGTKKVDKRIFEVERMEDLGRLREEARSQGADRVTYNYYESE